MSQYFIPHSVGHLLFFFVGLKYRWAVAAAFVTELTNTIEGVEVAPRVIYEKLVRCLGRIIFNQNNLEMTRMVPIRWIIVRPASIAANCLGNTWSVLLEGLFAAPEATDSAEE